MEMPLTHPDLNIPSPRASLPSFEEIKASLAPLCDDKGLQLVVLFGSAATGRLHRQSDIDLAFLYDQPQDLLDLTNRTIRQLRLDNVDVVDLRSAGPLLKVSVARTGRLLYERTPGLYSSFISLAFRMYADAKKFRDARKGVIQRFIAGRNLP
jgi:predicted nucleotidyltransferase